MKRNMTEETAMFRLADYCARGEHCSSELLAQLAKWGVPEDARMRIMRELQQRRYFDDERYAHAFVRDRVHLGKWGRRKIEEALRQKHISDDIRQQALDAVDEGEYVAVLSPLLQQKRRTVKAQNEFELNRKLVRYALSRGFTFDVIRQCLDVTDEDELADQGE